MGQRSRRDPAGETSGENEGLLRRQLHVYWLLVWLYRHGDRGDPAYAVVAARALLPKTHPLIAGRYRRFLREHDRASSTARTGYPP